MKLVLKCNDVGDSNIVNKHVEIQFTSDVDELQQGEEDQHVYTKIVVFPEAN